MMNFPWRSRFARLLFGAAVSAVALILQIALRPLLGPDSFQVFLGAVAITTMLAGAESGLLALALSGIAKLCLFVLPTFARGGHTRDIVAHVVVFMSVGGVICFLGKRLYATERQLKVLKGMLPICSACKQIREQSGEWRPIESYIREHSEAEFTHGLCPRCAREFFPESQVI